MDNKVLFISGHNRGGSTLLTVLLGQQKDFFPAGELQRIWDGGFIDNELCTCGEPFRQCEFWNEVIREAFGGWDAVNPQQMLKIFRSLYPAHKAPFLLSPGLRSAAYQQQLTYAADIWNSLYQAIFKISGKKVVVDSSKISLYGIFLNYLASINLYAVHLVRHSCGVAYSKQKERRRLEIHWQDEYMTRHSILKSSWKWISRNMSAELLKWNTDRFTRLKYETLATHPQSVLKDLSLFLGTNPPDLGFFIDDRRFKVERSHMFGGNPMRFMQEEKVVRLDKEWLENLNGLNKGLVIALTWPFLAYYQYNLRHPYSDF